MKRFAVFALAGLIGTVAPASLASAETVAEAYQVTVADGSCIAYKTFSEQHGDSFQGRLAKQYLTDNCAKPATSTPDAAATAPAATAGDTVAQAYQATAAIGSCGAYRIFEEQHRGSFYGRLASEYLSANCTNQGGQNNAQAATPPAAPPPGAVTTAPPPATYPAAPVPGATAAAPPSGAYPVAPPPPQLTGAQLAMAMQSALQQIGCNTSGIDGDWGRGSQAALQRFNDLAGAGFPTAAPSNEALAFVQTWQGGNCVIATQRAPVEKATVKSTKKTQTSKKGTPSTTAKKQRSGAGSLGIIIGGGGIRLGF